MTTFLAYALFLGLAFTCNDARRVLVSPDSRRGVRDEDHRDLRIEALATRFASAVDAATVPSVHGANTTFTRRRLLSPNDHKVSSLPGLAADAGLTHYAGHLSADTSRGGFLFYWLFETPKDPLNGKTIEDFSFSSPQKLNPSLFPK